MSFTSGLRLLAEKPKVFNFEQEKSDFQKKKSKFQKISVGLEKSGQPGQIFFSRFFQCFPDFPNGFFQPPCKQNVRNKKGVQINTEIRKILFS